MAVETAADKAHRLLSDCRLTVTHRVGDEIAAICVGDTGVYHLGFSVERADWYCSCPAHGKLCSHLRALGMVTTGARVDRSPEPA